MAREKARELRAWIAAILGPDGPSGAPARFVGLAIAHSVDWRDLSTTISARTLHTRTRLDEKTVRRSILSLIALGYLEFEYVGQGRTWKLRKLTLSRPDSQPGHDVSRPDSQPGHGAHARPGNDDAMAGQTVPHGRAHGPTISSEPLQKPLSPPAPSRGSNGARAPREKSPERLSLSAWRAAIAAIDAINGTDRTWADVTATLSDPIADRAIDAAGGHRLIADRTQYNATQLQERFRAAYTRELVRRADNGAAA